MRPCPRCLGKGEVGDDQQTCPVCGGLGELPSLSEAEEVGLPKYRRAEIPLGPNVRKR